MAFDANVSLVTVTGQYVDFEGDPIAGQIQFRVPKVLRNAVADQIVIPSTLSVSLDALGEFSVTLPATDDIDFHESFLYTITEAFSGGRTWQAALPTSPSTVDISDLVPAYTGLTFISLASGAMYTSLASRVTAAEASVDAVAPDTGIVVTLEYASLPVGYADYADVAASVPNYSSLSSSAILATSEAIAAFLVEAEAAQGVAEGWQAVAESWDLAVDDLVSLYPHPFVFVGAG
jgi:hypothetical protein